MALLLGACVDMSDVTRPLTVQVQVLPPDGMADVCDLGGRTVVMSLSDTSFTAVTDDGGIATFADIAPDIYDISASWKMATPVRHYTISGSLNSQLVADATPLQIATRMVEDRDIVIGKIASSGSKDQNNRTYQAGKYVELYNQSDEAVDFAGLYIGLLDSESSQPYTLSNLANDHPDSILVKQIFRIPADEPYLVQPGGTVLLVNSAVDHSDVSEYEYDLRGADFEAKDASGKYQNNPDVPALENVFSHLSGTSNMNLVQGGPCGVVIFRTDIDVTALPRTYAYGKTKGSQWLLLPVDVILDGVDYLHNKVTGVDAGTKRLPDAVDAGYTYINAISGKSGEVVYRRTASVTADGRIILEDTNNSSNDFQISTTIAPRQYDNE